MFDVDAGLLDAPPVGRALGQHLQQLDREMRRLEAELVATITEAERTGAHSEDGHSTVAAWCRALTKWSPAETAARLRVARLTQREASVGDALSSGELGVAQSREVGRAAANPRCGKELGAVLPLLLEHAAELSFEGFLLVVRRWEMLADTDGTHRDRAAAHAARAASLVEAGDEFILRANCDRATGAALKEIFDRFTDQEWQADWNACCTEHGDDATPGKLERTDPQRRFDALAAIFLRAASTPPDGQQPEPLVNLVIDTVTLERLLHPDNDTDSHDYAGHGYDGHDHHDHHGYDPDGHAYDSPDYGDVHGYRTGEPRPRPDDPTWWRSETTDGTPVPPDDVIAAMIWGKVRRIVIDTNDGTILDVGRRPRLFTGRARAAVLLASTRCTWPGCLRPSSRSQVHHRTEHQHGGATDIANGDACSARHNQFKSRARITVTRDEHGYLHHWRPDGTEIGHPDQAP